MNKIKLFITVLMTVVASIVNAGIFEDIKSSDKLAYAIACVESSCKEDAVGDHGKAHGAFQIWKAVVDDVNRIVGYDAYTYEDRNDPRKSWQMFRIYTNHYGMVYSRNTGKPLTDEVRARIWNGGPKGYRKNKTKEYWSKVKRVLDTL